ncbi:50S ribosomal protein L16 [Candidatus Aerophobetes bacterium]|uniref:Large ribosomal subunit protein uL16 n=1 Tax=Aerophobetes bacterium TaxID=2030807 RepID=A0A523QFS7_UNCAE|nr:MAG: 50S ribosomal protein L16 [Candidatus Aerophobetes bacterium]
MVLQPRRVKYRKSHRGRMKGKASKGTQLNFGEFGLIAEEPSWITARQIEASRITIVRSIKHEGKLWIRIFPDKAVSKKPLETRMGKGKGEPEFWVAVVRPGRVLFELAGVRADVAKIAFRSVSYKLPFKTKMISSFDEELL